MFYTALIILSFYLFVSFSIYKQIPNSISDTFYLGNKWWFTGIIIVLGFLISASLLIVTPENYLFTAFFTGASLVFVGAAPHFKDSFEKYIHFGGAGIFAISSQVWASLYCTPWLMLTWLSAFAWIWTKQRTFWAEIVCIVTLITAYIFK